MRISNINSVLFVVTLPLRKATQGIFVRRWTLFQKLNFQLGWQKWISKLKPYFQFFSKCVFQNVFLKMYFMLGWQRWKSKLEFYFSKCISQTVFYSWSEFGENQNWNCIFQNVFLKMYFIVGVTKVKIKTGTVPYASTDATPSLKICDHLGNCCNTLGLDNYGNDRPSGQVDVYQDGWQLGNCTKVDFIISRQWWSIAIFVPKWTYLWKYTFAKDNFSCMYGCFATCHFLSGEFGCIRQLDG